MRKIVVPQVKITAFLAAIALVGVGCYELSSTNTVSSVSRAWSGTGHISQNSAFNRLAVGLAGQNIHAFGTSGSGGTWTNPALAYFGGAHVLTSLAQTHSLSLHQHTFVHGNLVGQTNNLDLLHVYGASLSGLQAVEPWWPVFWEGGKYYDIVQVCDLAAVSNPEYGDPYDLESHLFMSFRACPQTSGACVGGVLEVQVDTAPEFWWMRSNQQGNQLSIRKTDGTTYSNECMPIAATAFGSQAKDYLVIGDPSWDEITIYDANRLWEGPKDSIRVSDSARNIKDIWVEGTADGSVDHVMVAALWKSSTSAIGRHVYASGTNLSTSVHLTETLPSNVNFITGRGTGADAGTADGYTFGSQVIRRVYVPE